MPKDLDETIKSGLENVFGQKLCLLLSPRRVEEALPHYPFNPGSNPRWDFAFLGR